MLFECESHILVYLEPIILRVGAMFEQGKENSMRLVIRLTLSIFKNGVSLELLILKNWKKKKEWWNCYQESDQVNCEVVKNY